jgi:hypothetical protein
MYKDPWEFNLRNYISWGDTVCHYPHFIAGHPAPAPPATLCEEDDFTEPNSLKDFGDGGRGH